MFYRNFLSLNNNNNNNNNNNQKRITINIAPTNYKLIT